MTGYDKAGKKGRQGRLSSIKASAKTLLERMQTLYADHNFVKNIG